MNCNCIWRQFIALRSKLMLARAKGRLREASFSSVYSISSAKTYSKMRGGDSWQTSRQRTVLLAEKMGKCKSENCINSNFIASLWLRQLPRLKQRRESNRCRPAVGPLRSAAPRAFWSANVLLIFNNFSYSVTLSLPGFGLFGFGMN